MKRASVSSVIGLLAILLLTAPVAAQEVQVPLDEAGQLLELDRDLATRIGILLDRYPELRLARLFQTEEGGFVLEVEARRDGRMVRHRIPMSDEEARELRARISSALASGAPGLAVDQDGRFLLLTTTTLLGLNYYGWALPTILDVESGRGFLATYMLSAGASFVLPYLYTRERPVSYGMANAGFWGATRGLAHGAYLANTVEENPDHRFALGTAMVFSLGEGLFGYEWARQNATTAGQAHSIGNFGDYGNATAGMLALVAQPSDDQVTFGALLAGSVAGLGAGFRTAPRLPYTWGDAEIERAGFYLGAAHGGVVFDWIFGDDPDEDDRRILGGLMIAGSTAGLLGTRTALAGHDFSAGEGILLDLGTVAGGLLGMGLAVLVGPEDLNDPTALFTLGALGADAGFLATFASLSGQAQRRAEKRTDGADFGLERLQLDINPGALAFLRSTPRSDPAGALRVPLLTARVRF